MAKVTDLIVCLKAENTNENGLCAFNILPVITPPYVPGAYSFSVAVVFVGLLPQSTDSIIIRISDPQKANVTEAEINANKAGMPPIDENLAEITGLNLAVDFNNVVFKMPGIYCISVIVNKVELAKKEILVKAAIIDE